MKSFPYQFSHVLQEEYDISHYYIKALFHHSNKVLDKIRLMN